MAKRVRATFDYLATEPGELSIKKGDIIVVLEEDNTGWWKGDLRGVIGFFPSNFVDFLPEEKKVDEPLRRMSMAPKPVKDNVSTVSEEYVRAKHNYKGSAADGELSFSKGDVLKVLNKDESGWWKGELNGRTGFFPHNFVVAVPAPTAAGGGGGGAVAANGAAASNVAAASAGGGAGAKTGAAATTTTNTAAQNPGAAATGPAGAGATNTSATKAAKLLKTGKSSTNIVTPAKDAGSVAAAPAVVAAPAAGAAGAAGAANAAAVASANSAATARIAELEKDLVERNKGLDLALSEVREARVEVEQLKVKLAEQTRRAADAEARAAEAEKGVEEASERFQEVEKELSLMQGEGCADLELNDLRDLKHKLKSSLDRVKAILEERKACPSCEVAIKSSILVPCLHAFCSKCGEKNKKQLKCSVCGIAPEKVYLLGGKK